MLNPNLTNPLYGQGIALIDEIELHLHPTWQQNVVLALKVTFPNIQFILTTHSPQILSTIDKNVFANFVLMRMGYFKLKHLSFKLKV